MTKIEARAITQMAKPLVENGIITDETYKAITTITGADGKPARELLTRTQAMKLLGVSYQTLINWERVGILKATKLAGRRLVRYDSVAIDALLVR